MLHALVLAILALTTVPGHKSHNKSKTKYARLILDVSTREKEDPFLVAALVSVESDYNQDAVNAVTGALGLLQVMQGSADHVLLGWRKARTQSVLPEKVLEPRTNLRVGIRILQRYKQLCSGNLEHALSSYNGNKDGCVESDFAKEVIRRYEIARSFYKPIT